VGGYLLLYVLLDGASLAFRTDPVVSLWYLADGASLALLLVFGVRYAPAIVVTSLITSFVTYPSAAPAATLVAWSVFFPLPFAATATLLRRSLHVEVPPRRLRDVVLLTLGCLALSVVLAGLFTLTVLVSSSAVPSAEAALAILPAVVFRWWIGEAIGLLVVAPLLVVTVIPWLTWRLSSFERRARPRHPVGIRLIAEASAQVLSIAIVLFIVFGMGSASTLPLLYLCFLPLIWITLRHALHGATWAIALIDTGAIVAARLSGISLNYIADLQVFMLTLGLTGLAMGAVVDEQRESEAQSHRRAGQLTVAGDLGRALAETLDLGQILERLFSATMSLLPDSETVSISLLDRQRSQFRCVFAWNAGGRIDHTRLPPVPLEPPGRGALSEPVYTHRPLIVNDLRARSERVSPEADVGSTPEKKPLSSLYAPMSAEGEVIGVVTAQSLTPDRYTDAESGLLALVGNTAGAAIQNARLFSETQRRLRNIQALHDIDQTISDRLGLRLTLLTILEHVKAELRVDAASIMLLNAQSGELEFAAGVGFRSENIERARLRLSEGPIGRAVLDRRVVSIPDLAEPRTSFLRTHLLAGEDFVALHAAPLIAEDNVVGVLEVFQRVSLARDEEWLAFLETLAGHTALAIDAATLITDLQRSNTDLIQAYDATIEGWSRAMDLRDRETEGHTQRVAAMTERLARAMGIGEAEIVNVRRGALLHDMGKMGIPDGILLKPGRLTDDEWILMRKHPQLAHDMLEPIAYLRPALDIPLYHHEKWDGSGYSHGLKGEEIPLAARLFAVIDVYDALTSARPYRETWSKEKAIEHLEAGSGTHFDPRAVECFVAMIEAITD
jgi:HD-GYP domain-containing protein (c-di-GMP phosphodiesterase class II)/integral membrane sensor domain MASE1